jgi:DNA-binding transcriptional LysR family regulator
VELRLLQYFLAVTEEQNFSRAAERLQIAQPSLSQQIRRLEEELETELFDRTSRPIRLTRAGELLLDDARRIVQEMEATAREVRRAGRGEVGRVRIGYSYGGLYELVLTLLGRLVVAWPEVDLAIHQLSERDQVPALRTGRVDVVLGRLTEPATPDITVRPLRDERLIAILPANHPLATGPSVKLGELAEERFVMFPRRLEPVVFDNYIQACLVAGFTMQMEHEVTDAQTQALAIAAGLGIGLSGEQLSLRFPGLVYLPVEPAFTVAKIAVLWCDTRPPAWLEPFLAEL